VSDLRAALLACVRDHPWSAPPVGIDELVRTPRDLRRLAAAAAWHRVESSVWLSLRASASSATPEVQALGTEHDATVASHLRMVHELRVISTALGSAGLDFAVLKGPVLAELCYERPDLRRYADLDVLVSPRALPDAVAALEGIDCTVLDENWEMLTRLHVGEIHVATRAGITIDLHWDLISDAGLRRKFRIRTDDLLQRAVEARIGGAPTMVLDPVDHLLHVALHARDAGANRLGWLKDVEQSMMRRPIDWSEVDRRAAEWDARFAVATVVDRTSRVLPGPVLDEALRHLRLGPAWGVVSRAVDRVSPPTSTIERGSLGRMFARASRGSAGASVVELARRGLAYGVSTLPSTPKPLGVVLDPANPASVLYPSGHRADYFAAVGSTGGRWTTTR
jgi:hypothetical protein